MRLYQTCRFKITHRCLKSNNPEKASQQHNDDSKLANSELVSVRHEEHFLSLPSMASGLLAQSLVSLPAKPAI